MTFGLCRLRAAAIPLVLLVMMIPVLGPAPAQGQPETSGTVSAAMAAVPQPDEGGVCAELPHGELSESDLARLVPDTPKGKVRIRWKTESQDECYGFNIYRSDEAGSTFRKINPAIISGAGSTNIPMEYCYEDRSVERGKTYFYYIEEISTQGVATKLADTLGPDGKGTRAKVKSVAEEREWLRRKALGLDTTAPAPDPATTATTATQKTP